MASSSSSTAASTSLSAIFLRPVEQVGRDLLVVVLRAERLVVPDDRLHADEVDDALEVGLRADRHLDAHRLAADAVDDVVDAA